MAQPTIAQPAIRPARLGLGLGRLSRHRTVAGVGLLTPAIAVTILFSLIPLVYLVIVTFTEKSTFFFTPIYTRDNYAKVFDRYLPTVQTTVELAFYSTLVDLVFGYP